MSEPGRRPHIILVGSGGQSYREYSWRTLADSCRLSAVLAAEPTWQVPYLDDWRVADCADEAAVAGAAAALCRNDPEEGILTWDETALETTARAAEKLSLPHMSPRSAARCRDKHLTRSLLSRTTATVRSGLARSAREAARIADSIGYPIVVKPRALAGSIGVIRVQEPAALASAVRLASAAVFAGLPTGHGVIIEEYLDGPEISVDSVVVDGVATCVHVARKRLGFDPLFEEVGHLVADWAAMPWAEPVRALVSLAHCALGVERGVTHAEVRLTSSGPRLVELNGRLGGDFIPYLGRLATGIDQVAAAAQLALGREPDITATRQTCAEVRFIYPDRDGIVRRIDLSAAAVVPGITDAIVLAGPGTRLLMPPRQAVPRLAALVAVAPDEPACSAALDRAEAAVQAEMEPLPSR